MDGGSAVGCSSNPDDKTLSSHRLPSGKSEKEIARRKKMIDQDEKGRYQAWSSCYFMQ